MRTAVECLAKANEFASRARNCEALDLKMQYESLAQGWTMTAGIAKIQDEWHARNPPI